MEFATEGFHVASSQQPAPQVPRVSLGDLRADLSVVGLRGSRMDFGNLQRFDIHRGSIFNTGGGNLCGWRSFGLVDYSQSHLGQSKRSHCVSGLTRYEEDATTRSEFVLSTCEDPRGEVVS